jgi:hypothetical protein
MWQVGVEGDLFDMHDDNEYCKECGCVPVKRTPEQIEEGLAEAREVWAKGPEAVVEYLLSAGDARDEPYDFIDRVLARAAAVRALRS